MSEYEHDPIEDSLRHAEHRHPVDFLEPEERTDDGIQRTLEVLARTFIWVADAESMQERGLRATVVLYCVRPDLLGAVSLEEIGVRSDTTTEEIEWLVLEFAQTIGWG